MRGRPCQQEPWSNGTTAGGLRTALAVARQVGIKEEYVHATMSPQGKAAKVAELIEKHGDGVAMVRSRRLCPQILNTSNSSHFTFC